MGSGGKKREGKERNVELNKWLGRGKWGNVWVKKWEMGRYGERE